MKTNRCPVCCDTSIPPGYTFALIYETYNSAIKTNQSLLVQIQFKREGQIPKKKKPEEGGYPPKQLLSPNLFSCPITHLHSPLRSLRISLWKFSLAALPTRQTPSLSRFFSGHPLVLILKKRRVHGCQIALKNTMKD